LTGANQGSAIPEPPEETGIRAAVADGVLRLVIDRPERKGAIDPVAVRAMIDVLEAAALDDSLRAVLLTSVGTDFCSGSDWVKANSTDAKPRPGNLQRRLALQAHRLIAVMTEIQLPIVCAVRGWAAGLGCQLALAADFTVAAEGANFWVPFTKRGFTPDSASTWLLPRLIGVARAKEMLMLGRPVTATDAAAWGMVHRAVPDDELDVVAEALVAELRDGPTVALGLTKRLLHDGLEGGMIAAMEHEARALELSCRTKDFREGLAAFSERREPRFTGR
jgi:2-(1,2-epoxy-1,2-dihydrophenyl)acetyl-CoA isomerase